LMVSARTKTRGRKEALNSSARMTVWELASKKGRKRQGGDSGEEAGEPGHVALLGVLGRSGEMNGGRKKEKGGLFLIEGLTSAERSPTESSPLKDWRGKGVKKEVRGNCRQEEVEGGAKLKKKSSTNERGKNREILETPSRGGKREEIPEGGGERRDRKRKLPKEKRVQQL